MTNDLFQSILHAASEIDYWIKWQQARKGHLHRCDMLGELDWREELDDLLQQMSQIKKGETGKMSDNKDLKEVRAVDLKDYLEKKEHKGALRKSDCILAPFPGKCIVRRDDAPSKYGALIIPEKYKVYPTVGIVVAVGDADQHALMGRKVLFPHLSGLDISLKNQPFYTCFSYSELLAVIEVPEGETVEFREESDELLPAPLPQSTQSGR